MKVIFSLLVIFSFSIHQNLIKTQETKLGPGLVKLDLAKVDKTFSKVHHDVISVDGRLKELANEIVTSPSLKTRVELFEILDIWDDVNKAVNEIVKLAEKDDECKILLGAAIKTKAAITDLYQAKNIKGYSSLYQIDTHNIKETDNQFRKALAELEKALESNKQISGLASKLIETINRQLNLELPKRTLTKYCRHYKMLNLCFLDIKNLSQTLDEIKKITEHKLDVIDEKTIYSLWRKLKELIEEDSSNKLFLCKLDHTIEHKIKKHIEDLEKYSRDLENHSRGFSIIKNLEKKKK